LDELQPILMNSTLTIQRAALLRVKSCHGRIILQQGLAPRQGNEYDLAAAVSSWSLDTLCGLVCTLNPEAHSTVRRAVGKVIADKVNCHRILEEKIIPLLLSLIEPSVILMASEDRNLSVEFENNKLTEWREIASTALVISNNLKDEMNEGSHHQSTTTTIVKDGEDEGSTNEKDLNRQAKLHIVALCLSFEEYNVSREDNIDNLSSANNSNMNRSAWFESLTKITPTAPRLTAVLKAWNHSSAPSASYPNQVLSGYDDDFAHFHQIQTGHGVHHGSALARSFSSTTAAFNTNNNGSMLGSDALSLGDVLVRNFQNGGSSLPPPCVTEFLSPWQAPEVMEEDAEDELAGDVYPYGDYLYGTAESSARGIGVGGAGGVVLDLSGVPELIPPMPRQRTSGPATSSRFRGVCRSKRTATDKWQAQISYGGTNYYLGLFDSESEAGVAYARAHYKFYGAGSVGLSSYASPPATTSSSSSQSKDSQSNNESSSSSSSNISEGNLSNKGGEGNGLKDNASADVSLSSNAALSDDIKDLGDSEGDEKTLRLLCSSKLVSYLKSKHKKMFSSSSIDRMTNSNDRSSHLNLSGLSTLPWTDELEKKYWIVSEEMEAGYLKSNVSARPTTPTKGLAGEKEKKRKGTKMNIDDVMQEIGLQSFKSSPSSDGLEWPFGGSLTQSATTSSSFKSHSQSSLISNPVNVMRNLTATSTSATPSAVGTSEENNENGMLSLDFHGTSWPTLSSGQQSTALTVAGSDAEASSSSPMGAAMAMLRPLIAQKKQEEQGQRFTFNNETKETSTNGHSDPMNADASSESVHVGSDTSENSSLLSGEVGYAKLVGFINTSHKNNNSHAKVSSSFQCTIMKSCVNIGNAAHEITPQGSASISSWHRALNVVCGAAMPTTALFIPGTSVGDMDIHLGDTIEPGANARILWMPSNNKQNDMNDSDDVSSEVEGGFFIHALSHGVAVEGKVIPIGNRVALSSGSVLSFGVNTSSHSAEKVHQPKVIAQFLLPNQPTSNQVVGQPLRASEKLVLGALRIATLDADLRRFLPGLNQETTQPLVALSSPTIPTPISHQSPPTTTTIPTSTNRVVNTLQSV